MREIIFVGLGLHDDKGISIKGLEEVKSAQAAFMELYTSLLPGFSIKRFETKANKKLHFVSRKELEDENGDIILKAAAKGKVVLLVPGDPLIATTHVALRMEAHKRGIKTRIVHGASIQSAAISLSGLHSYKFGKSVTAPFPEVTPSTTPYEVIVQNKTSELHTLCLLDIRVEEAKYLTVNQALEWLLNIEKKRRKKVVTADTIAVGIARAGSNNPIVQADCVRRLLNSDFGEPPHCIIFPGKLHFMEAEALKVLANAPESVMEMVE